MKAAFLDFDSLGPADIDVCGLANLLPDIRLYPETTPAEVLERIRDREIVIVNKVRLDAQSLAGAPALRLVCLAATGSDNVDLAAARSRGIAVSNIRDYCTASVVQHVFGLLLSLTLQLPQYARLVTDGAWSRSKHFCLLDHRSRELAGKTLGIVGLGTLGSAVARLGSAFGMQVIAAARGGHAGSGHAPVPRRPLPELLSSADVVSLHCPLTPDTQQLIDREALARMRRDAVLINTARGGLVDTAALADALRAGRLGGAGIDVLPEEPPVTGDPLLAGDIPNLIVTPHIAWAAAEARQRALDEILANIQAFGRGQRRNRLD